MKKILVLLLLFWMPLQASLAAFEEVHACHDHRAVHEIVSHSDGEPHHSHDAGHTVQVDTPLGDCNNECQTHHLCMAQLICLPSADRSTIDSARTPHEIFPHDVRVSAASERPERPQWLPSSN